MLFDFERINKKMYDKAFARLKLDDDKEFSKKERAVIKWFAYTLTPFILNVAGFLVLLWLFNRVVSLYGVEKLLVLFVAISVMNFRLAAKQNEKV